MATHSSVLAWRIPGTGEPDGLPSMGPDSLPECFPALLPWVAEPQDGAPDAPNSGLKGFLGW